MKTITTPNSANRIAKIIAEIRGTCIEDVDMEVIEEILQAAYDSGFDAGYDIGYDTCYASCNSAV